MEFQLGYGKKDFLLLITFIRSMTSWANNNRIPLKKKEPTIQTYFSSSEDYTTSTLHFLYTFLYCQRLAEPFYIHDTQGYFQPLLGVSPVVHFLKEAPPSAKNICNDLAQMAPIINALPLNSIKRIVQSVLVYNGETNARLDVFLSNIGLSAKQTYDVGIHLDISGCVQQVVPALKQFQKRSDKKRLSIFVMTDDIKLLQEFAAKGDPSWSYVSLVRTNAPKDKAYQLLKILSELRFMRQSEAVAVRFSSSLGKFLYITSDAQILSIDGSTWKAL